MANKVLLIMRRAKYRLEKRQLVLMKSHRIVMVKLLLHQAHSMHLARTFRSLKRLRRPRPLTPPKRRPLARAKSRKRRKRRGTCRTFRM